MNHPKMEEWLLYLDGASMSDEAKRLVVHLHECPACATELNAWQRTIHKLQRLPAPAPRRLESTAELTSFWVISFLRWGLAMLVLVFMGFALGRFSMPSATAMRKSIADELRTELRTDLLAAFSPEQPLRTGFQQQLMLDVSGKLLKATKATREETPSVQEFMDLVQQQRQQDQRNMLALIKHVRDLQVADCLALRQDLETAASVADRDLRQHSSRIAQLASTIAATQK